MWKSKRETLLKNLLGSRAALGLSRMMGRLADVKAPSELLKPAISLYSKAMGVDADAYEEQKGGFASFNEFFGRRLKEGERPICTDKDALISPCDGRLSSFGALEGEALEFSIKQSRYNLTSLLGSETDAVRFQGGTFAVIYLHPRDYHRVHAPCGSILSKARHIPGARYPVNGWCEALVENIYDKNERMAFFFDLPDGQCIALVMVAALGVGNIETPFDPGVDRRQAVMRERFFDPAVTIAKGMEIGAFLLGSTVVLIGSRGAFSLDKGLMVGPTRLGVRIGELIAFKNAKP
jgi:phosphatidylserine decarboxylase